MKLEVNAQQLRDAVRWASPLARESIAPMLRAVILVPEEKTLMVQATNGIITAQRHVAADIQDADGCLALDATLLTSYLARAGAKKSTRIGIDGQTLIHGKTRIRMKSLTTDKDDVPQAPKLRGNRVSLGDLAYLRLKDILPFIASSDGDRPVIESLLIEAIKPEGSLRLIAADGFKLVCLGPQEPEVMYGGLVPRRAIILAMKLTGQGRVMFDSDRQLFSIANDDSRVSGPITQGMFPDWRQIIPKCAGQTVTFETAALRESLDMLKPMVDDYGTAMSLEPYSATLVNMRQQEVEATLDVQWQGAPGTTIGFSLDYMLDCLAFSGEQTELWIPDDRLRAMRIDSKDAMSMCLIMPVHVGH